MAPPNIRGRLELECETCRRENTSWWEVHVLKESDLSYLYVSANHNKIWDAVGNQLENVAVADPIALGPLPNAWPGRIILWGHSKEGPFTIMEGNHRMIAYAGAKSRPPLDIDVYAGISPSLCFWHRPDGVSYLANDQFKR
jgi:hypothetical protein